jgi:hypothetical protein
VMDALIGSIVIDAENNRTLRYGIVERLNRGAIGLNEQELRNGLNRGPFCDLLAELENVLAWGRQIKGAEKLESSMHHGAAILAAVTNRINRAVTPFPDMLEQVIHGPIGGQSKAHDEAFVADALINSCPECATYAQSWVSGA